jgi:hypothetical protein
MTNLRMRQTRPGLKFKRAGTEDSDAVTIDNASNEAEEICPGKTEAPEIDDVSTRKTDNE